MKSVRSLFALGVILTFGACASGPDSSRSANVGNDAPRSVNTDGVGETNRGDTLDPTDQAKGSDADVEITRRIRERLTSRDSLSVNAQNVKIITLNGTTTLLGEVNSRREKAEVAKIARSVSGVTAVKNQLEVDRD